MSNLQSITFVYANGFITTVNDRFYDACKMALRMLPSAGSPIKVLLPMLKKTLYFDDDAFRNFESHNLTQDELIELTECDGIFRNELPFQDKDGITIDAGSLWKKVNGYFVLIDTDDYSVTSEFSNSFTEL